MYWVLRVDRGQEGLGTIVHIVQIFKREGLGVRVGFPRATRLFVHASEGKGYRSGLLERPS